MNNRDMQKVLHHLRKDPVVKAVYDAKSEEIGPNIFRFKAEIGAFSSSLKYLRLLTPGPVHLAAQMSHCLDRAFVTCFLMAACLFCGGSVISRRLCYCANSGDDLSTLRRENCCEWLRWPTRATEFDGERIVEGHMERIGGREQLLQQMYSAIATKKDDTVDLALRSYGSHCSATLNQTHACRHWLLTCATLSGM